MLRRIITRVVIAALCVLAIDVRPALCDDVKVQAQNKAASTQQARRTIERGLTFLEQDARK